VHVASGPHEDGTNHVMPERWSPLLCAFRHYVGAEAHLGKPFRAER
jgi:hypothetical protein